MSYHIKDDLTIVIQSFLSLNFLNYSLYAWSHGYAWNISVQLYEATEYNLVTEALFQENKPIKMCIQSASHGENVQSKAKVIKKNRKKPKRELSVWKYQLVFTACTKNVHCAQTKKEEKHIQIHILSPTFVFNSLSFVSALQSIIMNFALFSIWYFFWILFFFWRVHKIKSNEFLSLKSMVKSSDYGQMLNFTDRTLRPTLRVIDSSGAQTWLKWFLDVRLIVKVQTSNC